MNTRAIAYNAGIIAGTVISFVFTPWAGVAAVAIVALIFLLIDKNEVKSVIIGGIIGVLIGLAMYLTLDRVIIFD